jgi:hypothetical protein
MKRYSHTPAGLEGGSGGAGAVAISGNDGLGTVGFQPRSFWIEKSGVWI